MLDKSRLLLLSSILGLGLSVGAQVAQATPAYSVQTLGALGTEASSVAGFNGSGVAVGFVTNSSGLQVPVTFNGNTTALPGGEGQANGINNAGVVVGEVMLNGTPAVSEWTGGKWSSLGVNGYGQAINSSGEIAGAYLQSSNQMHAFTYVNGHLNDYGTLGSGAYTSVSMLNDAGQFTGTGMTSSGSFHAFVSTSTGLKDIGTLSSYANSNSHGLGISQNGLVAGASQIDSGSLRAFLYNGTSMQNLGTLGGDVSAAYGVNNSGVVVGDSDLAGNQQQDAFIYENGVMSDLNTWLPAGSGWQISDALNIDNFDDILAIGTKDGNYYALELTPVAAPEPAAFALMGVGLVLFSQIARRKSGK